MKILSQIKNLSIATIIVGLLSGILFVSFPDKCIQYISLAVGAAFIACAIVGIIAYLIDRSSIFTLAMGIILGIIGIIICVMYKQVISIIVIMIGIFVLAAGVTNLFAAFKTLTKVKFLGWITLILCVVTIAFGVYAITQSTKLSEMFVRIIGAGLIVYAIVDLIALIEVKLLYRSAKKAVENEASKGGDIEVTGSEV